MWQGRSQSKADVTMGEPRPGADVAGGAQSRCRCGLSASAQPIGSAMFHDRCGSQAQEQGRGASERIRTGRAGGEAHTLQKPRRWSCRLELPACASPAAAANHRTLRAPPEPICSAAARTLLLCSRAAKAVMHGALRDPVGAWHGAPQGKNVRLMPGSRAQPWHRCGRAEPSPSADVAGVSPVLVQMWER